MACRALIFATALLSTKLACSAAQTELKGGGKSTEVTGSAEGFDVDVFTAGSGEGKNGCFRIPTILSTNGTLLVFVERRFVSCNDGSPHSIELRRSVDSGRVWLPQQSLDAVGPNPPGTKSANAINGTVSNGAAVVDEMTGTIFFLYCRNVVSPFAHWTMVVSSTDLGVTWSKPRNAGRNLNRTGTSPGQGSGVQLASGRLVISNNGGGTIFSDDHGATWQDGSNWNPSGFGSAYGETQIALLSDGKTILNIGHGDRTKERYQMFAETKDGGETWGKVYRRPELVNVGCQQSMIGHTEADGRHFLYYAAPRGGLMPLTVFDELKSRVDGTVFASQDDGKSWWLLEPAVIRFGAFMYSGIVHRGGNNSHTTLGFVFESFVNQTAEAEIGARAGVGEPNKGLTITYGERTFALPPKPK